jgi:type I restriction enzyme S subunit
MNYKVPLHIDKNKVFIINYSELVGRYDSNYYIEKTDYSNCIRLSKIARVKGGKRIPLGLDYSNQETSNLYLRVANMDENSEFNYSEFKFISDEVYDILKRYEVFNDDLIISIAGTVGKIKIVNNIPHNKKIILTENCAKIEISDKTKILPHYLKLILQTEFLKKQIDLGYIQTTIPKLGIDKILGLKIPKIPSIERQINIIDLYQTSYNKKQKNENQAKELLKSIDSYLLNELGITLPTKNNSLQDRIFTTSFSEVTGVRLDPDYISKQKFLFTRNSKYQFEQFKNILSSSPQYGANEEAIEGNSYDNIRYIRITDIDEWGNLRNDKWKTAGKINPIYLLENNDILIARTGATVGKSFIFKKSNFEAIFAGYMIRFVVDQKKANPDYIFYYLNSSYYKYWISAIQRPSAQPNINSEEYKSLPIALPPLQKQTEIANHIQGLRTNAKQLQEEAKIILDIAKQEVERMILG